MEIRYSSNFKLLGWYQNYVDKKRFINGNAIDITLKPAELEQVTNIIKNKPPEDTIVVVTKLRFQDANHTGLNSTMKEQNLIISCVKESYLKV